MRSQYQRRCPSVRGQATLEYILMLAFVVVLFTTIIKGVLGPVLDQARRGVLNKIDSMVSGDNLHQLQIGR